MSNSNLTLRDYPYWGAETLQHVIDQLRQVCNIRKDDIATITQLPEVLISGRKVGKVPSASNDVVATDRIGDFNVTEDYAYYLIDDSGTAAWRRVGVSAW